MDFLLSLELRLRVDWLRKLPLNDTDVSGIWASSVVGIWLMAGWHQNAAMSYYPLFSLWTATNVSSSIHLFMWLLCYKLGALFSLCQMHCLGCSFTYPLTFHNGSQNGPIFSSPSLPVNSHHPDGSSLKTGELAHIVRSEKYQSLLSWQPIDTLWEEGGWDTFFYYFSGWQSWQFYLLYVSGRLSALPLLPTVC